MIERCNVMIERFVSSGVYVLAESDEMLHFLATYLLAEQLETLCTGRRQIG